MSMHSRSHSLDINEISQRINVQKPYFAFQHLWQDDEQVMGRFTAEQPLVYEIGAITAGELGRHLAILGSCSAVALHNGPEGYYLATRAHLTRSADQPTKGETLYASARVLDMDKRSLKIAASAWGKTPVAELVCEYTIITPPLFKRNFKHYANPDDIIPPDSPYQTPISYHDLTFTANSVNAVAGPLTPQQCAGHFYGYPCWPVAIIAQTAFQITGELVREKYGAGMRLCIRDIKLSANKLMSASNVLRFSVEITPGGPEGGLTNSQVRVYHNEEEVASLINQLELIPV
ncbi:hypothetical protein FEM41_17720 [Jejubacter calystegiae]|uniref:Uncharacterized protein n=1 Tax=Jejubacter calystegiae TaxID=2579935 RepID=A0A4P8YNN4_9ENTR|nr:hypothetical protein [Jejubacter calystegiae]QCT21354.1 hypothetical protein FEM41_17720 [Jejubacter calystegiae]